MGACQSSLTVGDTPSLVVEPMSPFPRGGRGIDRAKPSGVAVDDPIWSELKTRIDPLAKDLNRGHGVAMLVPILVLVAFITNGFLHYAPPQTFVFVFIPAMVITFSILGYTLQVRNRGVDRRIHEALEEVKPLFERSGYRLEYKTQHTGLCRPKNARSERVILFVHQGVAPAEAEEGSIAAAQPSAPVVATVPITAENDAQTWRDSTQADPEDGTGSTTGKSLMDQLKS
ncbi:hypothetical protein ACHAWF_001968 [Thalassiosira exigua]